MKYSELILEKNGKSGKMFNIHFIEKHYNEVYQDIIEYCNLNELYDLQFKEKVYHYTYDISNKVMCKNPNCNKETHFKNSTLGYNDYCSKKCISSDPNIKKIKEEKSIQKFGTKTPGESDVVKNKIIKTNQERYGYNSPLQNEQVQKKSLETLFKNHNVDNCNKSLIVKTNRIKKVKDNYHKNYENFIDVDFNTRMMKFSCEEGHIYDINYQVFLDRKRLDTKLCTVCNPLNSSSSSGYEQQLQDYVKNIYDGEIMLNNQKIIPPFELDIYIPDLKLGFEFNGLYWHNEMSKSKNYHMIKTDLCEEKDMKLIHIYEDEWKYKQEIVKSRILNILGKSEKIYARKCTIKEIDSKKSREFLNNNHIQGYTISKYNIGLFYNDELISLMTFGKESKVLNGYKMDRFCSKLSFTIIGAASKLLNYFIKKYNPSEIMTFADRSWSNGDLYKKLGFEFIHKTNPNYYYIVDGLRKHRFGFRKEKLIKEGFDSTKSEHEIMKERQFYKIYNSGHLKFVWKNQISNTVVPEKGSKVDVLV